jgi:hypothetical protein
MLAFMTYEPGELNIKITLPTSTLHITFPTPERIAERAVLPGLSRMFRWSLRAIVAVRSDLLGGAERREMVMRYLVRFTGLQMCAESRSDAGA